MIRESVFSSLQSLIPGCRFLDLFAGSGIMGVEAISRGAAFVLAVEQDARQVQAIRDSFAALGIPREQGKIVCADVMALMAKPCREESFDIIFMDPPYGFENLAALIDILMRNGWLKPAGAIVAEYGSRETPLPGFTRREYGDTAVSMHFFQAE